MSTSIAWTDETWNPIVGCERRHTGCQNCYAISTAARKLPGFERHNSTSDGRNWNGSVAWFPERLLHPFQHPDFRPRKGGRRVFVTSLSDLWYEGVTDEQRMLIHGAMLLSPWNTYQDLTKRPEVAAEWLQKYSPWECVEAFWPMRLNPRHGEHAPTMPDSWQDVKNIHRYASASGQGTLRQMVGITRVPAIVRGLSLEPLVGPVDLCAMLHMVQHVIVGGESGRNARPCAMEWIDEVRLQCLEAGVPVFVKQMGSLSSCENLNAYDISPEMCAADPAVEETATGARVLWTDPKGSDPSEWPERLRVREMP